MLSSATCKPSKERVAAWKALSTHLDSRFPPDDAAEPPSLDSIAEALREEVDNMFACAILRPLGHTYNADLDLQAGSWINLQLVIAKLETKDESAWAIVLLEHISEQEMSISQPCTVDTSTPLALPETKSQGSSLTVDTAPNKYSMETLLALRESPLSQQPPIDFAVVAAQYNIWTKTYQEGRDCNWQILQDLQKQDGEAKYNKSKRERNNDRPQRSYSDNTTSGPENFSADQRYNPGRTMNRPLESARRSTGPIRSPTRPSQASSGFRRPWNTNNAAGSLIEVLEYEYVKEDPLIFVKDGTALLRDRLTVTSMADFDTQKLTTKEINHVSHVRDEVPKPKDSSLGESSKSVDESAVKSVNPSLLSESPVACAADADFESCDVIDLSEVAPVVTAELGKAEVQEENEVKEEQDLQEVQDKQGKEERKEEGSSLIFTSDPTPSQLIPEMEAQGETAQIEVDGPAQTSELIPEIEAPGESAHIRDEVPVQIEVEIEEEPQIEPKADDERAHIGLESNEEPVPMEPKSDEEPAHIELKSNGEPANEGPTHNHVEHEKLKVALPTPVILEANTAVGEAVAQNVQPSPPATNMASIGTTSPSQTINGNTPTEKKVLNPKMDANLIRQYERAYPKRTSPYAKIYPASNNNQFNRQQQPGYGVYPVSYPSSVQPSKFVKPTPMVPVVQQTYAIEIVGPDDD